MDQHQGNSLEIFYWKEAVVKPHDMVTHTEHVLSYHTEGIIQMDHGQVLEAGPGMMTVLPAGVPHRSLGGENVALWLLSFCATCYDLDENHPMMRVFRQVRLGALPVVCFPVDRHEHLLNLFRSLNHESTQKTPESNVVIQSYLMLILAELKRAMRLTKVEATSTQGSLVADALAFIQAHCLTPISAKDVAQAVHRSPAHTTATLKKHTGFSAGQWITAGRVSEAARRLTHTDDSLEMIAEQVGWQDVTHFIRQFRKAFGKTPASYRQNRNASKDL